MQLNHHVRLMAEYNQWMNVKLYKACSQLSHEQLTEDRGAFFVSILGTLNHLAVADTIWLKRFSPALANYSELSSLALLSMPTSLNTILYPDLKELGEYRERLDTLFLALSKVVSECDLMQTIAYQNSQGTEFKKVFFSILMHVFNHQTHHRGQITTLLSQVGVDVGVTDLNAIIPSA
ncbi:damage-inducible protein DinB [Aliidiomarina shirensis]|uniref:Damage-inducible protein DinB n=1 Tax=Aliidiomarina shirensis TaxID=1048642 RepID=A0A432WXY3_9GAMM|nr:DinB family protein [Aliidiomarina shirensis]RUO38591.1 damage-inducible protein DinB [Aliidiomarina shirensis]